MNLEEHACVTARIQQDVADGLEHSPLWLRWWVRAHLVEPRPIVLCTNPATGTRGTVWLVTDDAGLDDSPLRIVFDGSQFGLEVRLEDGVSYLVHRAASFNEAVECL
jgi:hypothetical protein